jgi:trypsin
LVKTITRYPSPENGQICSTSCGGTIVSKNHILSAAHCFDLPINVTNIVVYIGSTKFKEGNPYNVTDLKIPESYNNVTNENDIAVLTLSQDIKFGEDVAAACFPTEPLENYIGQTMTVSGWGRMRDKKETQVLQVVRDLEIQSDCIKGNPG